MFSNIIAISSDCPISPKIDLVEGIVSASSFEEFMWGISWYHSNHSNSTMVLKDSKVESLSVLKSMFEDDSTFISNTFIAHIYTHSSYEKTNLNLQPFIKPYAGKEWTLVHNGDLNHGYENILKLSVSDFEPVGGTDSEHILCWFLSQLRKNSIRELTEDNLFQVHELMKTINETGIANITISNGDTTIVYQDKDNYNPISYAKFYPPRNHNNLDIGQVRISTGLNNDFLRTYMIFSSIPTENATWRKINPSQMIVVSHGRTIWNSDVNSSNYGGKNILKKQNVQKFNINEKIKPERILHIVHETKYTYDNYVNLSKHNIRMKPVTDINQKILDFSLDISVPCEQENYEDVFGNETVFLKTKEHYQEFCLRMEAKVAIQQNNTIKKHSISNRSIMPITWMPWQRQMMNPYLLSAELVQTQLEELMDYAISFVKRNDSCIMAILDDINKTIFYEYKFVSGSTTFNTTAYDVYATRQGVCQDFSNLFICLVRLLGLPARYRSGYIFNGGQYENTAMSDATHAWVEVYIPWIGWIGYDPTNGCEVNSDHIRVACGRNYIDATPTSGTIYRGGGNEQLSVSVKVFDLTNQ